MQDGSTQREHLTSAWRQTGVKPKALEQPKLDDSMRLLWYYFLELNSARTGNGFGANPLSYLEIDAWCRLTQTELTPQEVKAIKQVDLIYLSHQAKRSKQS